MSEFDKLGEFFLNFMSSGYTYKQFIEIEFSLRESLKMDYFYMSLLLVADFMVYYTFSKHVEDIRKNELADLKDNTNR